MGSEGPPSRRAGGQDGAAPPGRGRWRERARERTGRLGAARGLGADRRDSCASPSVGGSRLWMSVRSAHPSPQPQSPHLTLQTLTSLGGAASGALPFGFPAAGGQQSPFQPKWSAKGWESLRLARGHGWKPGTDGSREFLEGSVHGDVPAGLRPRPGRKTTLIP